MASIALTVIGCIDYLAYETIFTRAMFCQKKILDIFFCQKSPRWALGGGVEGNSGWECGLVVGVGQQGLEDGHCCWKGRGHRHRRLIPMQIFTMTFGRLLQLGREEESSEGNSDGTGGLSKPPNLQPYPNPLSWLPMVGTLPADGWQWASMYNWVATIWTDHLKLKRLYYTI